MSIFGNSIAITRYKVHNDAPLFKDMINTATFQCALVKYGFRSIIETPDETSTGWVHINDQEAATFDNPGLLWIGDFLVFSLRRDVRTIPPLILFSEIKKEMDRWLEEHPNFRSVPKNTRLDIKDTVKAKLMDRQLPDSQVWDVAWDTKGNMVYLFNTSGKAMEVFEKMFKVTFPDFALRYFTPWHQAEEVAELLQIEHDLKEKNLATSDACFDLIKSNAWLGRDLLLWLLAGQGQAACDGISAWVDCKIDLAGAAEGGGVEKITVTGAQHEMPAVKAALKGGSYLTKAGVFIEDNDGAAYSMVLAGETFAVSQFKTPTVQMEQMADDPLSEYQGTFLEKMALIQKGLGYLQRLLGAFLQVRVTYGWDRERRHIADWMEE